MASTQYFPWYLKAKYGKIAVKLGQFKSVKSTCICTTWTSSFNDLLQRLSVKREIGDEMPSVNTKLYVHIINTTVKCGYVLPNTE